MVNMLDLKLGAKKLTGSSPVEEKHPSGVRKEGERSEDDKSI